MNDYVHGYDDAANRRLEDQAAALANLLHSGTRYPAGARVLEAGCGVGAQTVLLTANSPGAHFTAIDISPASVAAARQAAAARGLTNVAFDVRDIADPALARASFDHAFVCFVLEHLRDPVAALVRLRGLIRPGGTITAIEGDHGSAYFHPDSRDARHAIEVQVKLQEAAGGNANIGRALYPLLAQAGFSDIAVVPKMVYVDGANPAWIEGFTRKTFTAMVAGVRAAGIAAGLTDAAAFDRGIAALDRTAAADGVFCYTFFKAVASVPA